MHVRCVMLGVCPTTLSRRGIRDLSHLLHMAVINISQLPAYLQAGMSTAVAHGTSLLHGLLALRGRESQQRLQVPGSAAPALLPDLVHACILSVRLEPSFMMRL